MSNLMKEASEQQIKEFAQQAGEVRELRSCFNACWSTHIQHQQRTAAGLIMFISSSRSSSSSRILPKIPSLRPLQKRSPPIPHLPSVYNK